MHGNGHQVWCDDEALRPALDLCYMCRRRYHRPDLSTLCYDTQVVSTTSSSYPIILTTPTQEKRDISEHISCRSSDIIAHIDLQASPNLQISILFRRPSHQSLVDTSRAGTWISSEGDVAVLELLVAVHVVLEQNSVGDLAEAEVDNATLRSIVAVD